MNDFYIVINGQKQGPFDIISVIKKVKNGVITSDTKIARGENADFVNANEIEEINTLLEEHGAGGKHISATKSVGKRPNLSLKKSFTEGLNLWLKFVINFTVISGIILAVSFSLSKGLDKISLIAEYPTIGNYFTAFITTFLYIIFFNYILLAKRNQSTQIGSFFKIIGSRISSIALLAALFSVYTLAYGVNELIGLIVLIAILLVSTFYIFSPFLIFDRQMRSGKAMATSIKGVKNFGIDNFGVILALIAINLVVAILPAFIAKELFVFGLFISIPITVSALSFIYDEAFA